MSKFSADHDHSTLAEVILTDQARMARWVACSQRWSDNAHPFVMLNIQLLGQAEPPIVRLERLAAESFGPAPSITQSLLVTQCSALSIYWMFGLYEVLRTLREPAFETFAPLAELFRTIEIIRMPLAKHEVKGVPAYRKVEHYPTSVWDPRTGSVGWQVFDPYAEAMIVVTRAGIAERFLSLEVPSPDAVPPRC